MFLNYVMPNVNVESNGNGSRYFGFRIGTRELSRMMKKDVGVEMQLYCHVQDPKRLYIKIAMAHNQCHHVVIFGLVVDNLLVSLQKKTCLMRSKLSSISNDCKYVAECICHKAIF